MTLFGASFFMKSAMLYRMTLVDTLASAISVCFIYFMAPKLSIVQNFASELDITIPPFDLFYEGGMLVGVAIVFALIAVTIVARKMGRA